MPEVYVIILNYKNWQDAIECLESLFGMDYGNFKIVIVDNNSGNNSLEHLMQWIDASAGAATDREYIYYTDRNLPAGLGPFSSLPRIVFIQNSENNGFAKGNNLAIQTLLQQDAYIWLLNPDITVRRDTLSQLVRFAGGQPFNTITGCTMRNYQPPHEVILFGGKVKFNSATVKYVTSVKDIPQVDYVSGGSLFTHTRHFKDIGLLPDDYFLYWEETDWCYKARKKGYNIDVCVDAVCYDKISATIGKGFLAEYYYTRNGLIFLSKYKKSKLGLAYAFSVLRLLKKIFTGKWDNAKGVYKGVRSFIKSRR